MVVHSAGRWRSHPVMATAIRGLVIVLPGIVGIATGLAVAVAAGRERWPLPAVAVAAVGGGALVAWAVQRAARRLLPLALLLELSLRFPATAPSRLRVARRAASVRQLQERLAATRAHGVSDATAAAERILELVVALQAHDSRTRGHAERVRAITDDLSRALRLPEEDRDKLRWAALLHDVGKLAVAADLLNKPRGLSDEEWSSVRRHPELGAELCGPLLSWLGDWGRAVLEHHERWDGQGYPAGLAGEQISYGARIVAVADAFEVMTAPRAYRMAGGADAARRELAEQAGLQFDPRVVRAFLGESIADLRWAAAPPARVIAPFRGATNAVGGRAAAAGLACVLLAGLTVAQPLFAPSGSGPAARGADAARDADGLQLAEAGPQSPTGGAGAPLAGQADLVTPGPSGDAPGTPAGAGDGTGTDSTVPVLGPLPALSARPPVLVAASDDPGAPALPDVPEATPVTFTEPAASVAEPEPTLAPPAPEQAPEAPPATSSDAPSPVPAPAPSGTVASTQPEPEPGPETDVAPEQPPAPGSTTSRTTMVAARDDETATLAREEAVVAVLANDDGDVESVDVLAGPRRGDAVVEDGVIRYAAPATPGQDVLRYRACDAQGRCDVAVLTIYVAPRRVRLLALDETVVAPPPGGTIDLDVLANDTDLDTAIRSLYLAGGPLRGRASVVDGRIRYVAPEEGAARDELRYAACTVTGWCTSATVRILAVGA